MTVNVNHISSLLLCIFHGCMSFSFSIRCGRGNEKGKGDFVFGQSRHDILCAVGQSKLPYCGERRD